MTTPDQITRLTADRTWQEYAQRTAQQEARQQEQPRTAQYWGYAALRGVHQARWADGSIVEAEELLSNAGVARGDDVVVTRDKGRNVFKTKVR